MNWRRLHRGSTVVLFAALALLAVGYRSQRRQFAQMQIDFQALDRRQHAEAVLAMAAEDAADAVTPTQVFEEAPPPAAEEPPPDDADLPF